jgi:hypothetical protein
VRKIGTFIEKVSNETQEQQPKQEPQPEAQEPEEQ